MAAPEPTATTPSPAPGQDQAQDPFEPFPLTSTQQAYLLGRGDAFPLGGVSTHAYLEFDAPTGQASAAGGGLEPRRLAAAWARLVARHDMLRAVIDPAEASQRVLADVGAFEPRVVDLRDRTAAQAEEAVLALREELSHEVRDPARWPLFSVVLSLLPADRARLHVGFDGLTIDYASWHVLYRDLCAYYEDPDRADPPLAGSFRGYVLSHEPDPDHEPVPEHEAAAPASPAAELDAARRYWRERLPDLPGPPRLPLARDPASVHGGRFRRRAHTLDAAAWERLRRGAQGAGLTPSAVLLTVYALVLGRWSRTQHFTVNVPRMNRDPLYPGAADLVGEFASFSLLAVDVGGDAPLRERARAVQRQLWADLEHHAASGVWVLRELARLRGGLPEAPMPVVLTSTLAWPYVPEGGLDALLEPVFAISQTPQVYLDAQIEERHGELRCNWDAIEEVFPPGVLDAMFGAWVTALARLADSPDAWDAVNLIEIPPVPTSSDSDADSPTSIADPPVDDGTATAGDGLVTLAHELFAARARRYPDAPALVAADGRRTYGELYDDAARLARWLHAQAELRPSPDPPADEPAPPVALVLDKGRAQIAAAFGVLFAGRAYAPIDAGQPPARLAAVLRDCAAPLVLVDSRSARAARDALALLDDGDGTPRPRCINVEAALYSTTPARAEVPRLDGGGSEPPVVATGGDDLAYVLYTSGSTGTPKGVMITHRGVVNCLVATRDAFAIGPADRVLGLTAAHHDMSVFDIFGVLGAGGTLVLPDPERRTDPAHWSALADENRVTLWNSVPATMDMLLDHVAAGQASMPATLRLAFLGGDWIPTTTVRDLARLAPGLELVSVGGPTETTLWNIWHRVTPVDADGPSIPYGRPVPGAVYHLLNDADQECPAFVVGEMCCSGVGLARGYWRDEVRTAASFTVHPRTGQRLYRTGDLGRYRPDGVIEFVGRRDQQIKIRGHRVEPAEVEAALRTHPGVRDAVVTPVPWPDRPGHRALTGWVIADSAAHAATPASDAVTGGPTAAAPSLPAPGGDATALLAAHLRGRLPAALVPTRVIVLDQFPLGANGKIDRAALATRPLPAIPSTLARSLAATPPSPDPSTRDAPDGTPAAAGSDDAGVDAGVDGGAQDAVAELLALVWAEVLGVPIQAPEDNFFELGGDSLAAARILARLRAALTGEELSLRSLLAEPTIAGAAAALTAAASDPRRMARLARARLRPAGETRPVALAGGAAEGPLTSAQRRFWFLHQLAPTSSAYQLSVGARLRGPLDVEALRAALADVVDRHDILRTVYPVDADGTPSQVVLDRPGRELVDLLVRDLPASATAETAAREFARRPLDLATETPLRGQLLRVGPREHILHLVLAHIAGDDPSWGILFTDLAAAYRTRVDRTPATDPTSATPPAATPPAATTPAATTPALPRYLDVAAWEAGAEHRALVTADLAWWREVLSPSPPPLAASLSTGTQDDPSARDDAGGAPAAAGGGAAADRPALRRGVVLDGERTRRVRAVARAHGTSPYMVLLAAAYLVLHRSSGLADLAVGAPVADRPRADLEGVAGNFGNTVVLRTRIDASRTLDEHIDQVRDDTLAAWSHQRAPFDDVVRALRESGTGPGTATTDGTTALFDVMFSYRRQALADLTLPGLTVEELPLHNGTARFPLVLEVVELADGFELNAVVDATRFTADDAQRLATRLVRVCEQVGDATPGATVGGLDPMPAAERTLVADVWSSGRGEPLVERTLDQLVEDQARRTPEAIAVVGAVRRDGARPGDVPTGGGADGTVTLTYAELVRRAWVIADALRAVGVGPETTVGVCVPRSAGLVVALLGVLRSSGAFVPLETSWPARRIAQVAGDAGVSAVVAGEGIVLPEIVSPVPSTTPTAVPVLRVDAAGRAAAPGLAATAAGDAVTLMENLAYVIYTSGSTGAPKGVMIRHQAICNRLRWQAGMLALAADDVVLHKAPLGFDISVNEIFLPLVAGARLVVAPPQAEGDPGELTEILAEHGVTFFYVVASMLGVMLERPDAAAAGRTLRHVWCGGEALSDELFHRFRARWSATMYHGYGPAEATIGVSCRVFRPGERTSRVSIGRPNPNTQLRILDETLAPVPVGAVGELYISGLPLARGYLGDPRRTADRFLPDPFGQVPGARMYRTGDLARFRGDGEIEFCGRVDNQVKVRGFRIELEEIEQVLGRHPAVRQAVVALVPGTSAAGPSSAGTLRAFCAREPATTTATLDAATPDTGLFDAARVREWLGERLPRHMVPDTIVGLDQLPLTPAGKVDRRAIAALEVADTAATAPTAFVAPAAGLQQRIAEIWADVLGVDRVGVRDSFFALGGHSLLLVGVQTRLEAQLGHRVAILDLFAHSTVEALARHLRGSGADPAPSAAADPMVDAARSRAARARATLRARRSPTGGARHE